MIPLKQRTGIVPLQHLVIEEGVFEAEGPVKFEIVGVRVGEVRCFEDLGMVLDKAVAEGGPGEEVEGYGVFGAGL